MPVPKGFPAVSKLIMHGLASRRPLGQPAERLWPLTNEVVANHSPRFAEHSRRHRYLN